MTLANAKHLVYSRPMRFALAIFAAMAIFVSGIHSGPVVAHEGDPAHVSVHHAGQGEEDGPAKRDGGDQHGCHHHCPSAAAAEAGTAAGPVSLGGVRTLPFNTAPLSSATRAPPLTPPKA